jgi:hypothetical protein
MRQGWTKVVVAIAAVAGTAGHEAVAAVCFPPAGGVPGEGGSGPPDWWSTGATPTGSSTSSFLDDPRWRGAVSDMAYDYERFRVVVENTGSAQYLVMSWEMNADSSGANDRLYFGVWDDSSASGNVYRLTRNVAAATAVPAGAKFNPDNAFSGRIFKSAGALGSVTWTANSTSTPPPLPTWLTDDARVDVSCSGTTCDRWAFRIRAKIDPAANIADATPSGIKISNATAPATRNFRFWYELQDNTAFGTTLYAFPGGLTAATEAGGLPPISFPDPNGWQQAQLGSGTTCDGDILFDSGDVYVNSVGSNELDFTSNVFHATPRNNVPATTIDNNRLTARFRIANWGSAGFNSPEWTNTCTASGNAGSAGPGTDFDLGCTWTGFDACPYRPAGHSCGASAGTKDRHQCILVDLGLPSGSVDHFFISRQSVFRNMNFDVNSKLVREATIDIKGLGPMPGGAPNRDVYLYVHTRNLPAKIEKEPPPPPSDKDRERAGGRGQILPPRERFKDLQLPAAGPLGVKESARIQAAVQAGKLTLEQVEQLMPTYIVYVWHDTGRTLATEGGASKIFAAQPSFGLFVAHDGDLEGYKHELTASGATLVAPNLYKFSPPNDSTFKVTTTIEPIECTGPLCALPTWIWILLALLLLLILLFILFRKKAQPAPPPGP